MDKKARGLPPTFQLDVARSVVNGPVELGDYLDEEDITSPSKPNPRAPSEKTLGDIHQGTRKEATTQAVPVSIPQVRMRPRVPVPKPTRLATSVPRKQVNMTPETLRMVEEILDYVRTYSV